MGVPYRYYEESAADYRERVQESDLKHKAIRKSIKNSGYFTRSQITYNSVIYNMETYQELNKKFTGDFWYAYSNVFGGELSDFQTHTNNYQDMIDDIKSCKSILGDLLDYLDDVIEDHDYAYWNAIDED